jgi:hypothetical protein
MTSPDSRFPPCRRPCGVVVLHPDHRQSQFLRRGMTVLYLGCRSQATASGLPPAGSDIRVTDSRSAFTVRISSMSPM